MSRHIGHEAATWWAALQPKTAAGEQRRGDRAALARLRRCATVNEAVFEPATLALSHDLDAGEHQLERVALIAAVLAHVRENDESRRSVARQMGIAENGTAAMSELRFRRLLQADTADEQLIGFRRLVALAGRNLNVRDLASALWRWDDADRRRWVYAYYNAPINDSPPTASVQEDASA